MSHGGAHHVAAGSASAPAPPPPPPPAGAPPVPYARVRALLELQARERPPPPNAGEQPFKRARHDPGLETGDLCSPTLFPAGAAARTAPRAPPPRAPPPRLIRRRRRRLTVASSPCPRPPAVPPRPRLLPLGAKLRPTNPPREPSGASAAAGAASAGAAAAAGGGGGVPVPLFRAPAVEALESYLGLVGGLYYTAPELGRSGRDWALLRRTTLGVLTSPVREPSVVDRWAPLEVARFEAALAVIGKAFPAIAKIVGTKTAADCVEFYYVWKQTKNYAAWKASYKDPLFVPDA